jgi:hypothetical protein
MFEAKDFYNAILVRGRRSGPTFDQVTKETRDLNRGRVEANLYRF